MKQGSGLSRRGFVALTLIGLGVPGAAIAAPRRIKWADLIPDGVAYGEMISNGMVDNARDIWIPEFDKNGNALNMALNGQEIMLAGYVIPLEFTSEGVTRFVLVPFVGACIHVPPPPPNQLVFVNTDKPWPQGNLWDAVLVTGTLRAHMQRTEIAKVGYEMTADLVEPYRK